jgi:hypothetical protein
MTRMHCKKCDAVFFMDSGGRLTLGEPPVEKPKAKKGGTTSRSAKDDDPLAPLKHIPKWFYWAIGAAVLGFVVWTGWGTFNSIFTGLPNGLESRATFFANAFLEKDWKKMKKLAADKEGQDELLKWVLEVRQYYPDQDMNAWGTPVIEYSDTLPRTMDSDEPLGAVTPSEPVTAAQTMVRLIPPPGPDGNITGDPFTIVVDWKKERGDWWIDGTSTNGNAKASGPNKGGF